MQYLAITVGSISLSQLVLLVCFGAILLGLLAYFIYMIYRNDRQKAEWAHAQQEQIQKLINTGEKLTVTLDDCQVVTMEESYEPEYVQTSADALLAQTGNPEMEIYQQLPASYMSYLKYEWIEPGTRKRYIFTSTPVAKDKETVLFYTTSGKTTHIYYDPSDPTDYYFDISFFDKGL